MLLEVASHPVYCAAFDGLFVLSISCSTTALISLNRYSSPCNAQRGVSAQCKILQAVGTVLCWVCRLNREAYPALARVSG